VTNRLTNAEKVGGHVKPIHTHYTGSCII